MATDHVAKASTTIDAPAADVWNALINPQKIKKYMFGATVVSDFKEGSSIVWKGEFKGKPYEDKGRILRVQSGRLLEYSHFSPLTGEPDKPENYHTVTIALTDEGSRTRVMLSQNKNATEEARKHSEKNWSAMLEGLKKLVEG